MVIGIDPGLMGAIVRISDGDVFDMKDMPVVYIKKGKSGKNMYDIVSICNILRELNTGKIYAYVEKTQPMRGVRVQASWGLGYCEGMLVGMLAMLNIPYELIHPKKWHNYFGIVKSKGDYKVQAYQIAKQLFPQAELTGPKGGLKDGRSDALLIAEYGRRHLQGEM